MDSKEPAERKRFRLSRERSSFGSSESLAFRSSASTESSFTSSASPCVFDSSSDVSLLVESSFFTDVSALVFTPPATLFSFVFTSTFSASVSSMGAVVSSAPVSSAEPLPSSVLVSSVSAFVSASPVSPTSSSLFAASFSSAATVSSALCASSDETPAELAEIVSAVLSAKTEIGIFCISILAVRKTASAFVNRFFLMLPPCKDFINCL